MKYDNPSAGSAQPAKDMEAYWDQCLQIRTGGRDDTNADQYRHPYEPTPYSVLERLSRSGFFGADDTVLDYGCGKGRVGFFLSSQANTATIGIEYDAHIYAHALENQNSAVCREKTAFVLAKAEEYAVPGEVNRCYFFNPFSAQILHKAMARILDSYYENPRELLLFFYYPADEYMAYLMSVDELEFYDEIDCTDLFAGNDPRERIMIFQLPGY